MIKLEALDAKFKENVVKEILCKIILSPEEMVSEMQVQFVKLSHTVLGPLKRPDGRTGVPYLVYYNTS